ncbi:hypothetical protein Aple_100080 [Acrocarpospora pleiomorpha]|uniref:Uncharacterized protein n=1 Tax=Acrocarpospora pleiomorpha TaxID=90975 RepID=A0A5M3Y404_9ACTN|nr:hypothetical protein Aple_100080 [Acrocarpospora pleiomorpha]
MKTGTIASRATVSALAMFQVLTIGLASRPPTASGTAAETMGASAPDFCAVCSLLSLTNQP